MSQLFLFDDNSDSDPIKEEILDKENTILNNLKVCRICNTEKSIEDFHLDRGKAYSKCKECFGEYKKNLRIAKKSAPDKPEVCECCNKIPDKWICDHYPDTDIFRGWVCSNCNLAAGYMNDSYDGAIKLFNYLYQRKV